jgi:outer membrane lipoprotein SlyB
MNLSGNTNLRSQTIPGTNSTVRVGASPSGGKISASGSVPGIGTTVGVSGSMPRVGGTERALRYEMGTVESVRYVILRGKPGSMPRVARGDANNRGEALRQGVELSVKLDDGGYLSVLKEHDQEVFAPGERVKVVKNGSSYRVTR